MQECLAERQMVPLLQVTKIYWDFRKGLVPIIGGSRWVELNNVGRLRTCDQPRSLGVCRDAVGASIGTPCHVCLL
jgi:hypothetical protein